MATVITGSVSSGSLRNSDLIPAFEHALSIVAPAAYAQCLMAPFDQVPGDARFDQNDPWWESEDADIWCQQLADTLEEYAPEGHYFGPHWGDGADFGFWPEEES